MLRDYSGLPYNPKYWTIAIIWPHWEDRMEFGSVNRCREFMQHYVKREGCEVYIISPKGRKTHWERKNTFSEEAFKRAEEKILAAQADALKWQSSRVDSPAGAGETSTSDSRFQAASPVLQYWAEEVDA